MQPWAKPELRAELSELLAKSEEERQYALLVSSNDHLLALLGEERGKYTQSDKDLMGMMIRMLIAREVYPTEWNGKPIDVVKRVEGWGADWHKFTGKLNCPHCNADLRDLVAGPPFKREIGHSDISRDRTVSYSCPDCKKEWPR